MQDHRHKRAIPIEDCLDNRKKLTEFDLVRWLNSIAETCKMTKFARTVKSVNVTFWTVKYCKPYFWFKVPPFFFIFASKSYENMRKHEIRRFRPAFLVGSTKTLIEIYNTHHARFLYQIVSKLTVHPKCEMFHIKASDKLW